LIFHLWLEGEDRRNCAHIGDAATVSTITPHNPLFPSSTLGKQHY
jgi:hypothetical protein